MKTRISNLKYVLSFGVLGIAIFFGSNISANAKNHSQRAERRDLRNHQRQENRQFRREERYERNGYYGNNGYFNNGYYNNNGYYGNNGYYNNGRYNNRGGYYGNGRYYTPHRDSRNSFKRGLHHLFGGH